VSDGSGSFTARKVLASLSDSELLSAIRRGDVSPIMPLLKGNYSYRSRMYVMRGEAERRGIL